MHKKLNMLVCGLLIVIISGCSSLNSQNTSVENELKQAFEEYLKVKNEVQITYDTTNLSKVAVGDELENILSFIETYENLEAQGSVTTRSAEEFDIEKFDVLAVGETWAVVEVKKNYLTYSQNLQSGERTFADITRWRIQRFLLTKDNGRWKVDKILEDVGWSG